MSGADPCAMLKHGALLADAEGRKGDARDYRMALAAVAELIEADRELDAAYTEFPAVGTATPVQREAAAYRINAAHRRRAAALTELTRVGGAA